MTRSLSNQYTAIPKAEEHGKAECLTCGHQAADIACPKLFDGADPPLLTEAVALIGNTDYCLACLAVSGCDWRVRQEESSIEIEDDVEDDDDPFAG